LNLVVNARDAMPDGGRLTIETANAELDPVYASTREPTQPGHYVMIAVTDSGIGMTPEVKARLFEPFFTTKELGKGTGLGLSTTYGIIKQSGGYIWCYSEPGHGTAFKIYLPRIEESGVHAAATVPAPAAAAAAASGGGETILLVEDQPELRYLLLRLLKMQGYAVMAAANPEEAVAITRDFKGAIHLMVTDVVMPGMNGPQLADQIVGSRPDLKVLFMSGYTDDAVVRHGLVAEERSFLQKPFTPHVLLARLREVLDSKPTYDA
jgi:CheY-like chemotaxis protein